MRQIALDIEEVLPRALFIGACVILLIVKCVS